jgi:hypothetical protein
MCLSVKSAGWIAALTFTVAAWSSAARADPVRITVNFHVAGDDTASATSPTDPTYGYVTAPGSFSILTEIPAGGGQIEDFQRGLGADLVSFDWAGTSWTRHTADVGRLIFDPHGSLVYWELAGLRAGLMDIRAGSAPDIYIDPFAFQYSAGSNLFEGRVMSSNVWGGPGDQTPDPDPVPEPMPFALVASGLAALVRLAGPRARS